MNPILKNILAVVVGIIAGSAVNMLLVNLNGSVIALPEGADLSDMTKLKESMKLFQPIHFLFPFLGHAFGTLVGAFLTAKIAGTNNFKLAMVIGVWFLIGGITIIYMVGGPLWFQATDVLLAYIPMAWLGAKLAGANN